MKKLNQLFAICTFILSAALFVPKDSFATLYTIDAPLTSDQEVPANPSTGIGQIRGSYDDVTMTLSFQLTFTGLTAGTTAAHFHAPAPRGVIAPIVIPFAGFPTGVTSGFYANTYVLTPTQNAQIIGGLFYVNIHTTAFPGGEIRGQLEEGTLPVELASFSANVTKGNVNLKWTTSSEINNASFDVERKLVSASSWTKVGNVAGNGNSTVSHSYTYSDKVSSGVYTYRLKQIDFNGNFMYYNLSNEVNVGIPSSFSISQNYPNPFNPTTKIDYELPFDANVNITLFDISGKEVLNVVNETKTAGYYSAQVNASSLASGTYFYNITAGNFVQTKKMTVIK